MQLSSPRRNVKKQDGVSPPGAHAWKVRDGTRPNVPHASTHDVPPWRACLTPFCDHHSLPFASRAPPGVSFFPTRRAYAADAALLRRGELSRVRSQLPASSIALRAFLHGCDAFPPERIRPPESTVIFLRAHPRAPARSFQLLASPVSSPLLSAPGPSLSLVRSWATVAFAGQRPANQVGARHMLAVKTPAIGPTSRWTPSSPSSNPGSGS